MRILFLTAQLPEPAHAGGTLRTNGLMRGVRSAGHEVHLISFAEPDQFEKNEEALRSFCTQITVINAPRRSMRQRLHDLLFTSLADMQQRYASPDFANQLETLLTKRHFDLIQIESLEMATYLPVIKHLQPTTPVIYDSFNAEYELQHTIFSAEGKQIQRLPGAIYSWIQWKRLTQFERYVCQTVDHVIAVSTADAEAFKRLTLETPVSVVPNGLDMLPYAKPDASLNLGPHALVFTGSMAYRPNVDAALWFAEQILGPVRQSFPDARFFIVGSQPHRRLDTLRSRDDVQITGWVPDVTPFLYASAVYVVPLRMGSGTRLKLLQAMAAKQAVVSTRIGAQGLDVADGVQLHLADTAADFTSAIVALLRDPAQREALGLAGSAYVRKNYDWAVIVPRLLDIYDRLTKAYHQGEAHD